MAKFNFLDIRGTKKVPSAFGNVFICSGAIGDAKTVTFPDGYLNGAVPEPNLAFKAVFPAGHNAANASSYLSLNGIVVVSNQNGALLPLPVHAIIEGGSTVYKVLQPNTVLELYYTADYDGNSTPAFVVIGNPVVLSSADYTIYANGKVGNDPVGKIIGLYKQSDPYGYLFLDGSSYDTSKYSNLYDYLGSNKLPDYREFALVGAGENTTDIYNASTNPNGTIHDHDTYTQGQAKDDCVQTHKHIASMSKTFNDGKTYNILAEQLNTGIYGTITYGGTVGGTAAPFYTETPSNWSVGVEAANNNGRSGTVTRGKRKAVFFYIKY